MATKTCAEAFEHSHPAGVEEMEKLVRQASAWHFKLTKEAAMGKRGGGKGGAAMGKRGGGKGGAAMGKRGGGREGVGR